MPVEFIAAQFVEKKIKIIGPYPKVCSLTKKNNPTSKAFHFGICTNKDQKAFKRLQNAFISVSDNYIQLLMGTSLPVCLTANSKQPRV